MIAQNGSNKPLKCWCFAVALDVVVVVEDEVRYLKDYRGNKCSCSTALHDHPTCILLMTIQVAEGVQHLAEHCLCCHRHLNGITLILKGKSRGPLRQRNS